MFYTIRALQRYVYNLLKIVTPCSLFDELGTNCEHIYIDITDAGDHKFAHLCKACKRETAKDGVLLAKSPGSGCV